VPYEPEEHVLAMFDDNELAGMEFRRGTGCDACSNTGYNGRLALLEFLEVKGRVVRLVSKGADSSEIREAALEDDLYYNIRVPGLAAVRQGIVTIEEVARVMTDV
jgi:type II secretory ATPase GspE/PulE/Tfp pilus assembly ATPase PilB-like protein